MYGARVDTSRGRRDRSRDEWRTGTPRDITSEVSAVEVEARRERARALAAHRRAADLIDHTQTVAANYAAAVLADEDWTYLTPVGPDGKQDEWADRETRDDVAREILTDLGGRLLALEVLDGAALDSATDARKVERTAYKARRKVVARASESAEERTARLASEAARKAAARKVETPKQRQARLQRDRDRKRELRASRAMTNPG